VPSSLRCLRSRRAARRAGRATYKARGKTQEQRGQMIAYLQEILGISGIMLVKAFGTE
jgi:hypothetical protein